MGKQCRGALSQWPFCLESHTIAGSATSTTHTHTHSSILQTCIKNDNQLENDEKIRGECILQKSWPKVTYQSGELNCYSHNVVSSHSLWFYFLLLILGKQTGRLLHWRGRMVNQSSTAEKFIKKQLEWLSALLLSSVTQGQTCTTHTHTHTHTHTAHPMGGWRSHWAEKKTLEVCICQCDTSPTDKE